MRKTLRTITMLVLTLTLLFALTACGNNSGAVPGETTEYGDNAVAELLNDGYEMIQTTCDETIFKGILKKGEGWENLYYAEAPMTSELYATYDGISYDDEDCDARRTAFLTYLEDATVTDISDKVPTQEELNEKYIGKTIGDLIDEGYEDTGYTSDPDTGETSFFYDGPEYCLTVSPKKGTRIDMDDMSKNDIKKIVIDTVEFQGMSGGLLG